MKPYRMLALIVVIAAIAIWMDLPNNPGIHIAGINRDIETRLGLDLVGGVQALLEADLPEGTEIDAETMRTATRIVENRVNGMGVTEAVVQQAGDRRIVVELPGETDPEKALETLKQTGLLEFVEMDYSPLPDGMIIKTDFAVDGEAEPTDEESSTEETIYHTVMTGATIKNVGVTTGPAGGYEVAFELTEEGTRLFSDYTSANSGKFLGIVLDKEVVSAPRIDEPITEGAGVIRGEFTIEDANSLAIQLRYGSLPIPMVIVESRTVGPTLGQDSLSQSLTAGIVGLTIMVLFMALYYRIPGVIADVSILIYALLAFALFRFVPVTLTLPGIAGLMLSTGSALDANILIFERLKEELRNGRRLSQAIDIAWVRAWPSIRDSNIATLITCAILFWFGSSFGATLVKGFSLTLALGVGVSLFSAIVVTRTLLNIILGYFKPANLERWFGI
ncbi:MAG: protein translocase subunit SecD [Anaerolineales bacterium]|nr:protein translocase subunit SecD [Anaerolineales bacterium]